MKAWVACCQIVSRHLLGCATGSMAQNAHEHQSCDAVYEVWLTSERVRGPCVEDM